MKTVEFTFDSANMRILRTVRDESGNIISEIAISPEEALETDSALIEELIDFGEAQYPNLFIDVRNQAYSELQHLRTVLLRMAGAIQAYAHYKDDQELFPEPEPDPQPESY